MTISQISNITGPCWRIWCSTDPELSDTHLGPYLSSFSKRRNTFKLKNKSKLPIVLKLRILLSRFFKTAGEVSRVVRERDRDVRGSFKRRKNVLEMFGDEHLIKRLHFLSYSKWANHLYITNEHHNWRQCGASIMPSTLYDEYISYPLFTRHASVTAPRPPIDMASPFNI